MAAARGFSTRHAGYGTLHAAAWDRLGPVRIDLLLRRVGDMDNEVVRRLMWAGLVAATGALATVVANRVAAAIWVRVFGEDPPE